MLAGHQSRLIKLWRKPVNGARAGGPCARISRRNWRVSRLILCLASHALFLTSTPHRRPLCGICAIQPRERGDRLHYPDFRLGRKRAGSLARKAALTFQPSRPYSLPASSGICNLWPTYPCPRREDLGNGLEWTILSGFGSQNLIDGITNPMGKVFIGLNQRALNPPISFLLG